ncbi:MAG: hypothetical protein HC802_00090 [Caldilineaceae bacterium]|nr:hypothetical protein [Caldilineaceae bacterium]
MLNISANLFSPVSSPDQRNIAVELAQFLSNQEQSFSFARQLNKMPANSRVRINPRLNPELAVAVAQSRGALPLPNVSEMDAVFPAVAGSYAQVLEAGEDPVEVAADITEEINTANGIGPAPREVGVCSTMGTLNVLHSLEGPAADALARFAREYSYRCPLVNIMLQYSPADDLPNDLIPDDNQGEEATHFDLLLGPHIWSQRLLDSDLIRRLPQTTNSDQMQRYFPRGLDAFRVDDDILGVPDSLNVPALYYNKTLVETRRRH